MKKNIRIIFILLFTGCINNQESKLYFEEIEEYKAVFEIEKINTQYITSFNDEELILIGNIQNDTSFFFSQRLFVVNKKSKEVLFEYTAEVSPYDGSLYQVSAKNRKFVLWEIKNEYYSDLLLFQFKNDEFSYIGEFEVGLNPGEEYFEDLSYPVAGIEIDELKDKVNFRFTKNTILYPYDGTKTRAIKGQLIYQFDLSKNELGIRK